MAGLAVTAGGVARTVIETAIVIIIGDGQGTTVQTRSRVDRTGRGVGVAIGTVSSRGGITPVRSTGRVTAESKAGTGAGAGRRTPGRVGTNDITLSRKRCRAVLELEDIGSANSGGDMSQWAGTGSFLGTMTVSAGLGISRSINVRVMTSAGHRRSGAEGIAVAGGAVQAV